MNPRPHNAQETGTGPKDLSGDLARAFPGALAGALPGALTGSPSCDPFGNRQEPPGVDTGFPRRWILLRGLVRETAHFEDFPHRFQTALGGDVDVIGVDLAGNGKARQLASPTRIEGYVAALRRSLSTTAAPDQGPVGVLAMSMGAWSPWSWAQRFPGEVSHMVLINSGARALSPFWRRLRPRAWGGLAHRPVRAPVQRERHILALTSTQHQAQTPACQQRVAAFAKTHAQRPTTLLSAVAQITASSAFSRWAPRLPPCQPTPRSRNQSSDSAQRLGRPCAS